MGLGALIFYLAVKYAPKSLSKYLPAAPGSAKPGPAKSEDSDPLLPPAPVPGSSSIFVGGRIQVPIQRTYTGP